MSKHYSLGLVLFMCLIFASPVYADSVQINIPVGATPAERPLEICIWQRTVSISPNILGNDAPTMNVLNLRPSQYAFTGEQIRYDIVVRDANGALDIGHAVMTVDNGPQVICNEGPLPDKCDGLRIADPQVPPDGGPAPKKGPGETDKTTDRGFHCIYTVEPVQEQHSTLKIRVTNSRGNLQDSLYQESWFLNPALEMQLKTSDNMPISFENGEPGEYVHSTNNIWISNDSPAVSLWMFIASTDLYDPSGASKCPYTNKFDVEGTPSDPLSGMYYRATLGSLRTSVFTNPRPGDKPSEGWAHFTNFNQNLPCTFQSIVSGGTCTGARPLISDQFLAPGFNVVPGQTPNGWAFNALTPSSTAQIELKLKYPVPCIGSFSSGKLIILGKPV